MRVLGRFRDRVAAVSSDAILSFLGSVCYDGVMEGEKAVSEEDRE